MSSQSSETTKRLTIDVWADVICPWCYLGEARLAAAIEQAAHGPDVDLRVHTFQLHPSAPTEPRPVLDDLAKKFEVTRERAEAMEDHMAQLVRAEGLPYVADRSVGNTLDALRLVHLAEEYGVGWELLRAIQLESFSNEPAAYEHDGLTQLAVGVGVPEAEAREVLASDRYAEAVRTDHERALDLGATGVPFVVLGGAGAGIPGAVTTEQYGRAIDRAWERLHGEVLG